MYDFGTDFQAFDEANMKEKVLFSETQERAGLKVERFNMQPEIRHDIPGIETALVYGNPYEAAVILDDCQGDNSMGALGNCGLVSTANFLTVCGYK